MTQTKRAATLTWCLALCIPCSAAAQGEPPDEPGLMPALPAPPAPAESPVDPEDPRPAARSSSTPRSAPARPLATVQRGASISPMDKRPVFSLGAQAGYAGLSSFGGESVHGPLYSAMLSVTLGSWPTRGGIRLAGHFSNRMTGTYQPFLSEEHNATAVVGGATLTGFGEYRGLWLAAGLGLFVVDSDIVHEPEDGAPSDDFLGEEPAEHERSYLPEFTFGAGYDLALGDHFAIRFALEGGTLFLIWRGSASAGLVARF